MTREVHVRFCESLGVQFPGATHPSYRLAEGSKQSFTFQDWPETAALLKKLGANTRLGMPGTVQERLRDVPAAAQQQQQ
jgi:hypothetical protein